MTYLLHIVCSSAHCRTNGKKQEASNKDGSSAENMGKSPRPVKKQMMRILWQTPKSTIHHGITDVAVMAICITDPSKVLGMKCMSDSRKCGADSFVYGTT
jgi:hypothetical protein